MKKKGQVDIEFLMNYGWVFLAAIIVIGVLAVYIRSAETNFGITKEECEDVVTVVDNAFQDLCLHSDSSDYTICFNEGDTLTVLNATNFTAIKKERTGKVVNKVCEQVEVEEIEYTKETWRKTNKIIILKAGESHTFYNLPFCRSKTEVIIINDTHVLEICYEVNKISKDSLTTEWLDENAECVEGICSEGYEAGTHPALEGKIKCIKDDMWVEPFEDCNKWKYEDYTVEVMA